MRHKKMNKLEKDYQFIKKIEEDLQELDIQINKSIRYLENNNYWKGYEAQLSEEKMEHTDSIRHQSFSLFKRILFFLKLNNYNSELNEFNKKIYSKRNDDKFLMEYIYFDEVEEIYSNLTGKIYSILFPIFEYYLTIPKDIDKSETIFYRKQLERLLRSTGLIVSRSKKIPTSEPQIYNIVKDHIKILLPDLIDGKTASFNQKLKTYIPDFSSEISNSVVEYKYIKTNTDLKKTIDDLCADAKAYKSKDKSLQVYTVLYFKKYLKSEDEIKEFWKEKEFPKNWKYILIIENIL